MLYVFHLSFLLVAFTLGAKGQVCIDGTTVGHPLISLTNYATTKNLFLMIDSSAKGKSFGEFGCYGAVKNFKFRCARVGTGTISFQVWRLKQGTTTTMKLVGKHEKTMKCATVGDTASYDEFEWNYIPIKPGDRLAIQNLDTAGLVSLDGSSTFCTQGSATTYHPTFSTSLPLDFEYNYNGQTNTKYCMAVQAVLGPGSVPEFDNLPASIKIPENSASGITLYQTRASDANTMLFSSTGITPNNNGDSLLYSLSETLDRFTIDSTTGIISTALTNGATFDYEALATDKFYSLVVMVHDAGSPGTGNSATATLTVRLQDVNEEHAVPNLPSTVTIHAKSTPANTEIYRINMTMVDGKAFGSFKYQLISNSQNDGAFAVGLTDGIVSTTVDMTTKSATSYLLSLSVDDGSYLVTGSLTVNVLGANSPPIITNTDRIITVPENSMSVTNIFKMDVTDPDKDKIIYSIKSYSGTPDTGENKFKIDSTDGSVFFVSSPSFNYESQQTYTLTLSASDDINSPVHTTLTVNIQDVNEKPAFNPKTYSASINENLGLDQQVLQLTVSDPDTLSAANRDFQFSLLAGTGNCYFSVKESGGYHHIYTSPTTGLTLPNSVKSESYVLTIGVRDRLSSPYRTDVCTANITVHQVNTPHSVSNLPASISIDSQSTHAGHQVYIVQVDTSTIQAMDSYTYILKAIIPNDGTFLVDPVTGAVNASVDLQNHTTPLTYQLDLCVTDRTYTTATSRLTINIINIKSPPVIINMPSAVTVSVAEDLRSQVTLFQIFSSDPDNDKILTYNIKSILSVPATSNPLSKFVFDSSNGVLKTALSPSFDAELVSSYTLTVNANDYLHTSVDKTLVVNVLDVNEAPVFNTTEYTLTMNEETAWAPLGGPTEVSSLLQPDAFDAFDPDGDILTYSILPSTYSSYFTLDSTGSSLLVVQRFDLDAGEPENFTLEILVDDSALQSKAILSVHLVEINDNSPVLSNVPAGGYTGSVYENAKGGTSILTLSATDIDRGTNGDFVYELFGTNFGIADLYFQIDPKSGVLSVKDQIDYEQYPYVWFQVRARSVPTPYYYTQSFCNVTVIDVNDIRPTFVRDFFNLEVVSTTKINTHIATLLALDNDADLRGDVRYYFLVGEAHSYFKVDENTGMITTSKELDADAKYGLYGFAEDRGYNKDVSTAAIVRVDSYSGPRHLIAVTLDLTLDEYYRKADDFLLAFNAFLSPWIVKVQSATAVPSRSARRRRRASGGVVINIYALRNNLTDSVANMELPKAFVYRDDVLALTRADLKGRPTDPLLAGSFSDLKIIKVEPAFPIWWIDTVEGRVTIGLLCLLFLLFVGALIGTLCYCWRAGKLCFKRRKSWKPPTTTHQRPLPEKEFNLKYKDTNKSKNNTKWKPQPPQRTDSASTIHSQIYPSKKVNNFDLSYSNPVEKRQLPEEFA